MKGDEVIEYNTDIILDPDFYLHLTILQAIKAPHQAIQSGNAKDGLISLIIAIDQLERIAKASGRLKNIEEYEKAVEEFENKMKEKERDELLRKAMTANYKLQLLLTYIFKALPKAGELVI